MRDSEIQIGVLIFYVFRKAARLDNSRKSPLDKRRRKRLCEGIQLCFAVEANPFENPFQRFNVFFSIEGRNPVLGEKATAVRPYEGKFPNISPGSPAVSRVE